MNLETLYIQIEAETSKIKSQMASVNNQVSNVSKEASKANKSLSSMGKAVIAAFSIRALVGFFNKFLEITKQTEAFKKALAEAFDPIVLMVQPALTAMITGIAKAIAWISGVIQAMTGWTGATKKQTAAAQAQKRAYAGFDELNVVPSDAGAAAPVVEPLIDTNKYIEQGKKFWADYGKQITDITKLIAILGTIILSVLAFNAFTGFIKGLGIVSGIVGYIMAAYGDAYLVLTQGATAANWLSATFAFLQGTLAGMLGTIAFVVALVIAVGAAIWQLWNEAGIRGEKFRETMSGVWQTIIDFGAVIMGSLKPWLDIIGMSFIWLWEMGLKPLWDGFVNFINGTLRLLGELWITLSPIINFLLALLSHLFGFIMTLLIPAFNLLFTVVAFIFGGIFGIVGGFFDLLADGLKYLRENWDDVWGAISKGFKNFVNPIIDGINMLLAGLNKIKFDVPKWVPVIGGQKWGFDIPMIPRLAEGGMPNAGSLFVAGEAGAELIGSHKGQTTVMPLQNTDFTAAMGQAVYGAMVSAMSTQGNGSVVINVDGMTLAKSVETNLNKLSTLQGGLKIAM